MLEYFKLIVDLLKGIAWPSALFGILLLFRTELRSLLPRVVKAGPTVEFDKQAEKITRWTGKLNELPNDRKRTPPIEDVEKSIHTALQNFQYEQQIDVLVNELAVARLSTLFERIYGAIYGSQIAGLRALANASGGRTSMSEANKFFEEVKFRQPGNYEKIDFASWSGFLKNFNLTKVENDVVEITPLGRDFLQYLVVANLPENKPM